MPSVSPGRRQYTRNRYRSSTRFFPDARAGRAGPRDSREFEKDETGLVVVDGELIERPVIRSMLRVLAIADHLENAG